MECGCVEIRPHNFLTLETKTLRFRNSLNALFVYYYNMCTRTRLIFYRVSPILPIYPANTARGGTRVNFCWVCAADLSEPLPHYSLFCG